MGERMGLITQPFPEFSSMPRENPRRGCRQVLLWSGELVRRPAQITPGLTPRISILQPREQLSRPMQSANLIPSWWLTEQHHCGTDVIFDYLVDHLCLTEGLHESMMDRENQILERVIVLQFDDFHAHLNAIVNMNVS